MNWTFASREDDEEEKAGNNDDEAKNVGKVGVAPAAKAHSSVGSGNTVGDLPISGRKQPEVPTSDDKEGPCMPGPAMAQPALQIATLASTEDDEEVKAGKKDEAKSSKNDDVSDTLAPQSKALKSPLNADVGTVGVPLVDERYASSNNGSDDGNSSDSPSSST